MKRFLPVLLLSAPLAPASHGRVGETLEECRARYGQETGKDDESEWWEKAKKLLEAERKKQVEGF